MTQRTDANAPRLSVETSVDEQATRIALIGEVDDTNVADLDIVLAGVEPDGATRIDLDLSELAFVDVAALRRLTLFARQRRQAGRDVRTYGAQPLLEQVVHVVGAHEDLGLI